MLFREPLIAPISRATPRHTRRASSTPRGTTTNAPKTETVYSDDLSKLSNFEILNSEFWILYNEKKKHNFNLSGGVKEWEA